MLIEMYVKIGTFEILNFFMFRSPLQISPYRTTELLRYRGPRILDALHDNSLLLTY